MAVLNIKNLPDFLYRKLQARAKRQHRSVAQEVTHLLNGDSGNHPSVYLFLSSKAWGKSFGKGLTRRST